ncbi:hypothetical protein GOP47_0020383 [Adiantum capillus-veneris]|uniref:Uncharacterized protein n=1 Tax=Adiantum capillus-veneris TaxID=13818 RepID=A0A9D4UDV0_ADICA|nr:hypothetical protein GOP47_0020383 [Adiantum capillus-veneris]
MHEELIAEDEKGKEVLTRCAHEGKEGRGGAGGAGQLVDLPNAVGRHDIEEVQASEECGVEARSVHSGVKVGIKGALLGASSGFRRPVAAEEIEEALSAQLSQKLLDLCDVCRYFRPDHRPDESVAARIQWTPRLRVCIRQPREGL